MSQTLFIPNKSMQSVAQPGYRTDMQAIETWAQNLATGGVTNITTGTPTLLAITSSGGVFNINYIGAPGAGYASLTGPGDTSPTGALTQGGGLTVSGDLFVNGAGGIVSTAGIINQTAGQVSLKGYNSSGVIIENEVTTGSAPGVFINDNGGNGITIQTHNGSPIFIGYDVGGGSATDVEIETDAGTINIESVGGGTISIHSIGGLTVIGGGSTQINSTDIGFFNKTPTTRQTVTGSRGGNAALASLLTGLANLGLITDSSTP